MTATPSPPCVRQVRDAFRLDLERRGRRHGEHRRAMECGKTVLHARDLRQERGERRLELARQAGSELPPTRRAGGTPKSAQLTASGQAWSPLKRVRAHRFTASPVAAQSFTQQVRRPPALRQGEATWKTVKRVTLRTAKRRHHADGCELDQDPARAAPRHAPPPAPRRRIRQAPATQRRSARRSARNGGNDERSPLSPDRGWGKAAANRLLCMRKLPLLNQPPLPSPAVAPTFGATKGVEVTHAGFTPSRATVDYARHGHVDESGHHEPSGCLRPGRVSGVTGARAQPDVHVHLS